MLLMSLVSFLRIFNTRPMMFCFRTLICSSACLTSGLLEVLLNNKLVRFCCNANSSLNAPDNAGSFCSASIAGEMAMSASDDVRYSYNISILFSLILIRAFSESNSTTRWKSTLCSPPRLKVVFSR